MHKDRSTNFKSAYIKSKPDYKRFRQHERRLAFRELLLLKPEFVFNWALLTIQAMCKLVFKEQKATKADNGERAYQLDELLTWLEGEPDAENALTNLADLLREEHRTLNSWLTRIEDDNKTLRETKKGTKLALESTSFFSLFKRASYSATLEDLDQALINKKIWWNKSLNKQQAQQRLKSLLEETNKRIATLQEACVNPLSREYSPR